MALTYQRHTEPYDHWIIDNLLDSDKVSRLIRDFPDYDSPQWFRYDSALEKKSAIREWGQFPAETYSTFQYLCSPEFVHELRLMTGCGDIVPDYGLHGAGWHLQTRGDHLNVHLDYSIHPRIKLQRKFNLIIYLTQHWDPAWGGNLELWSHDSELDLPDRCVSKITPAPGRAVLFDTSGSAWHGFADAIQCPPGVYRCSLAMYYLTTPSADVIPRLRARYAPSPAQQNDPEILRLIQQRSQL